MKKVADIGCGINKVPGAIGIDAVPGPMVDVVCDLSVFPWPFEDDEFDEVTANHFLEHCVDIVPVICEMHRITKKNTGKLRIRSPHYTSWNFFGDLTHRTPFSYRSFDHFTYDDDPTGYNFYSPVKVKIESRRLLFAPPDSKLNPWKWIGFEFLVNKFPNIYERLFAYIFPCTEAQFLLTPINQKEDYEYKTVATVDPAFQEE
jgi:SAM-dependent methyltransferase